jgi:hypothetical protein
LIWMWMWMWMWMWVWGVYTVREMTHAYEGIEIGRSDQYANPNALLQSSSIRLPTRL